MHNEIRTIHVPLPLGLGHVNCYLISTDSGFVLIDTGVANGRDNVERELERAGCRPGNLTLILLTHGDFDHIGNAAFLRRKFGTRIAMHTDDAGMAERGDMFWNRKSGGALIRVIAPLLFRFGKSSRFSPDLHVEDGYDFSDLGLDATVVGIPGHSKGSIGVLTSDGSLVCGDLLENSKQPVLNSIMDDPQAASDSVEKLRGLAVTTVYPGHGEPFPMAQFVNRTP
ncbi:MAG: MBL fold metallo-hydrolase [Spirochaetales bacterium]|nr:MAG: MBL fold metallo-hydrolase [Spirochaetales bacterium]